MYGALSIAKYIISHEQENHRSVSNLRLQKLLYFVQAQFLVSKDQPCFVDEIEAWDFGPVVPTVYHHYKMFGSATIPCLSNSNKLPQIPSADKSLIDSILDQCSQYSTTKLVSLTHDQDPWIDAYSRSFGNKITNESIKLFFKG